MCLKLHWSRSSVLKQSPPVNHLAAVAPQITSRPHRVRQVAHQVLKIFNDASSFSDRDLAVAVGTLGHVAELRRLRVGPFSLDRSISLDSLKALAHSPAAFEHLQPVETALDGIPALALPGGEALRLRHGQSVSVFRVADRHRLADLHEGDLVYATDGATPIAIGRIDGGCILSLIHI